MKRTTRSFAGAAVGRLEAMRQQQKQANKKEESVIEENKEKANQFGYKHAACLCCWNHDTNECKTCWRRTHEVLVMW